MKKYYLFEDFLFYVGGLLLLMGGAPLILTTFELWEVLPRDVHTVKRFEDICNALSLWCFVWYSCFTRMSVLRSRW